MFCLVEFAGDGLEETQRVREVTGMRERQNWKKKGRIEKITVKASVCACLECIENNPERNQIRLKMREGIAEPVRGLMRLSARERGENGKMQQRGGWKRGREEIESDWLKEKRVQVCNYKDEERQNR